MNNTTTITKLINWIDNLPMKKSRVYLAIFSIVCSALLLKKTELNIIIDPLLFTLFTMLNLISTFPFILKYFLKSLLLIIQFKHTIWNTFLFLMGSIFVIGAVFVSMLSFLITYLRDINIENQFPYDELNVWTCITVSLIFIFCFSAILFFYFLIIKEILKKDFFNKFISFFFSMFSTISSTVLIGFFPHISLFLLKEWTNYFEFNNELIHNNISLFNTSFIYILIGCFISIPLIYNHIFMKK